LSTRALTATWTGVEAALLTQRGFTASPVALEGRFGWHDVICRGEGDLDVVTRSLDGPLAVKEGMVFKAYPCCGANHYAIGGVLRLMKEQMLHADDVDSIDVDIEARSLMEVLVYPWPTGPLEGKFSLAYNVAAAVQDGPVTVDTFTAEAMTRLAPFHERVRLHTREELPPLAADVTIHTTDGRALHRRQGLLRGSLDVPMSWDELVTKFEANTHGHLGKDATDEVVELIAGLGSATPVRALTDRLLVARSTS
jgi:2-methylcitrate dehydratase PrpD